MTDFSKVLTPDRLQATVEAIDSMVEAFKGLDSTTDIDLQMKVTEGCFVLENAKSYFGELLALLVVDETDFEEALRITAKAEISLGL